MPTKPPHACARCGAPTLGPCPVCVGVRDRDRGTPAQRGYTTRWFHHAQAFRARFPFCGQRSDGALYVEHSLCARAGRKVLAQCVDHIIPMSQGGVAIADANSQSLCYRCNNVKAAALRERKST